MEVKIKGHKSMAPQQHPQKLNIVLSLSLSLSLVHVFVQQVQFMKQRKEGKIKLDMGLSRVRKKPKNQ